MKNIILEESVFSELPQQICDRVPNTFYRYQNKTRFWNGKELQCEHKKAGNQCPICNPEGWKQKRQKRREYYQKNKAQKPEQIKQKIKEYYKKNKERIKEYYKKNKERIKEYRQNNKEQIKEYRQNNKERIEEREREYRQKHKGQAQEYRQKNKERIKKQNQEYQQKNKERLQEYGREWKRTSVKNRCNDLCICFLHSETHRSFKYKNKFGCDDGSVRVCYECATIDIRSTEDPELKKQKNDYYNIHTTKTRYLFRIEYAILCHLNDYPLIDQMNQEVLNIHDKDIVSIVGKTTTIEKRPDRAYLMNNNLIFFEIDETGADHEKSIERLLHLRNRLQTTFEDDRPINLHVFRFNTNEQEGNSMVERREFPSGVEQKEVGYVLSKHGCNVIENDFIPLFENVYQDCKEMVDIENDKHLMVYEINASENMIDTYLEQNQNIVVSDYLMIID